MSGPEYTGMPAVKPSNQSPSRAIDVGQLTLASLRRRPTQRRGAQRITDVLDAFEQLLAQRRCEEITMEDLSRKAGIQIGSLYHFFPDITAVILTVLERALADEGTAFESRSGDEQLDFLGYLGALERRMTDVWQRHGSLMEVFFAYQRHPLIWKITRQQRERTAALVGSTLMAMMPDLPVARAQSLGRMIGVVMAVLVDNLGFLPDRERRRLRDETYLLLSRYVEAEGVDSLVVRAGRSVRRPTRSVHAARS